MSPTCRQDEMEARANKCNRVEKMNEELKYWLQDVANKLEYFVANLDLYGDTILQSKIIEFVKEIEKEMRKKTNEVMGYK